MPSRRRRRRACCRPQCPRYNCYVPYTPPPAAAAAPAAPRPGPVGPCEDCARLNRDQKTLLEQLARVTGEMTTKDSRLAQLENQVHRYAETAGKATAGDTETRATLNNAMARAEAISQSLRRHLEESRRLDDYLEKEILGSHE